MHHVKCDDLQMRYDSINITYPQPALVGSNAIFNCPLGLEQTGPNSLTCMKNGEWEPYPRDVECRGDHDC